MTPAFGQTISVESSKGLISACVDTYAQFPYLQVFSISGNGLISGISLNTSSGFQLSTQKDSDFSTSLLLDHVSGSVQPTLIYIRSTPRQVAGSLEGTVEILTNGVSPKVVQVSATIETKPILTQISNIEVESGSTVNQINFISQEGTSVYSWENDQPEIGLPESGQGPIPSFNAFNPDTEPKVAKIKYRATSSTLAYIPTSGGVAVV
ncbi:MAG: hypothetical protein KF846_18045, partial [Cyclobacteriaceae bacterium]|nr:hypothetical protein [Cyclobacteriaceae bacterium]